MKLDALKRFLLLIVALTCLPDLAGAQAQPSRAPTPAWVTVLPIPSPDPARQDRPAQTLLVSNQTLYVAIATTILAGW